MLKILKYQDINKLEINKEINLKKFIHQKIIPLLKKMYFFKLIYKLNNSSSVQLLILMSLSPCLFTPSITMLMGSLKISIPNFLSMCTSTKTTTRLYHMVSFSSKKL
jgi:hypothetical protein